MILKSRTQTGRVVYFDAFSGKEVHLNRMLGRGKSRLPDIAIQYLTPAPRKPTQLETPASRLERRIEERKVDDVKKLSWMNRILNWIKSFWND